MSAPPSPTPQTPRQSRRHTGRRWTLSLLFLLALIVGTIWILRYRGTSTLRVATGQIFGTTYHIKYEASEPLERDIALELQQVDNSLSTFNPQSTLARFNAGKTDRTDAMLYEVLTKAREISEATGGAFDVTVMPLVNAWGFGPEKEHAPSDAEVARLLRHVGYRKITLRPDSTIVKADPAVTIDLAAIAKGYGVDRIARLLREHGVRNYMVEIGGEVVTKGRNPKGEPWKIGVSNPQEGEPGKEKGELQTIMELENAALATSGNYRNFYVRDGRRYAHTIDPKTGHPVQHSLLSATVIAPDCATADAYATSFMVMGVEKALKVVKAHPQLKAYLIYEDAQGKLRVIDTRKL